MLLKETDPQQQSSKKHHWARRLVAFAFFAIFVGGVIFTAWSVFYWLEYFLEKKQTYGSITVEPFQYSREQNTISYDLQDQVPAKIKKQRYKALMELQQKIV